VTVPAVTLKLAVAVPAGTVTAEGTVSIEADRLNATTAPPAGAGPARVIAQFDVPELLSVEGRHTSELILGNGVVPLVTLPPDAVTASASPICEAPRLFVTPIAVSFTPGAIARFTTATTPSGIELLFSPHAMQVYVPEPPLQLNDLLEAVAADPGVAEIETTFAAG
jgi:hypothetical protein